MDMVKYSAQVHMAKDAASASPPYEQVPNILLYTFYNLFINLYTLVFLYDW